MSTIGLIAAMASESKALLNHIEKQKRTALGRFRAFHFHVSAGECMLITTGIGQVRAADGTRTLIEAVNPDLLIAFGIAGAVYNDLHIGDVIVAEQVCLMDKDRPGPRQRLAALSNHAWDAAEHVLQEVGGRLFSGTAVTTDGSQVQPQTLASIKHPILEMETAGIARVAAEASIPLIAIRSISDRPKAPIPFDLAAVYDDNYNLRLGKMLLMVLRKPKIIIQSRQLIQNSSIAADHAAQALMAVLNQASLSLDYPSEQQGNL
jgi:5'-methylthioadenosine/S-adenosylhomocysteine nucleosidase